MKPVHMTFEKVSDTLTVTTFTSPQNSYTVIHLEEYQARALHLIMMAMYYEGRCDGIDECINIALQAPESN